MRCSRAIRRLVAVLVGLVALQSCDRDALAPDTAGPTENDREIELATVAGVPDGNGHPNVGALAFDVDRAGPTPPFGVCGGFVVSDHVFLTAAHCIAVAPNAQWVVTLEPGSPDDPIVLPGIFPDDRPFPVTVPVLRATQVVVHPLFGQGHPRAHDVAVLLFPEGTFADVTPVELPEEGELDALAAHGGLHGQDFTLVAYGTMPITRRTKKTVVVGYRQVVQVPFQGLTSDWLLLQATGEATGEGGVCRGDSGSPFFLGESNVAMALVGGAGGSEVCGSGVYRSQRLDTPAELDFIAQFMEES